MGKNSGLFVEMGLTRFVFSSFCREKVGGPLNPTKPTQPNILDEGFIFGL